MRAIPIATFGEVVDLVSIDDAEYALEELAARRLVDVFSDRDEFDAALAEFKLQSGIKQRTARKAGELPYDHVVDVADCANAVKKSLQPRALVGASAETRIGFLGDDIGPEFGGSLRRLLALCRDGSALGIAVAADLSLG